MSRDRSVVSSAVVLGVCTLLSRVTGFVRDMLVNSHFGLTSVADSFWFAFTIPNLLRRLFAEGAIAAVFVPPFTKKLARSQKAEAWRLLARTLALQTLALSVIIALIELALLAIWWFAPGGPEVRAERGLVLLLTAIMQPYTLTVCVTALFASILNCVGSFAPAGIVSAILNVGMIVGLYAAKGLSDHTETQAAIIAASVVVSGVAQILFLVPSLRAKEVSIGWELNTSDPDVRAMLTSFVPVVFGQGALLLGTLLDNVICWGFRSTERTGPIANWFGVTFTLPLDEGALATLNIAQRLYQFPLGVAAISLAIAALPKLSRLLAHSDWDGWSRELRSALRLSLFVGLLSGVLLIVMGDSFFRLLFERGRVGPEGTARAAPVIAAYGWGMWAFCAQQIVLRGFYSRDDVRTPLRMSLLLVPLNSIISFALIWHPAVREAAFGWASTVTSSLGVIFGLIFLRRGAGAGVVNREFAGAAARMLIASIAAAVAVAYVTPMALARGREWLSSETAARVGETLIGISAGVLVYLAAGALLRLPEPGMLVRALLRRRGEQAGT
jgi:putative peptidoglycan lipid II flippase